MQIVHKMPSSTDLLFDDTDYTKTKKGQSYISLLM